MYKLKSGTGIPFTTWTWSTLVDEQMGEFVIKVFQYSNSSYKLINSVSNYDNWGNPLTVTGVDGIQTDYSWGYNNYLLTSASKNSGSLEHKTSIQYQPLVGATKITDPNVVSINYEYDSFGRLKLVKDSDNNIVTRYRYHYKDQSESLSNYTISYINTCNVNGQVELSSEESLDKGQTTYKWNFGDGAMGTSTGPIVHTYPGPGLYTVSVRKENPEYYSIETSFTITIYPPTTYVNLMVDGPQAIYLCNTSTEPTIITSDYNGLLQSEVWEYRFNSGPWTTYSGGTPPGFGPSQGSGVGEYNVRYTLTDSCGNLFVAYTTLTVFDPGICEY